MGGCVCWLFIFWYICFVCCSTCSFLFAYFAWARAIIYSIIYMEDEKNLFGYACDQAWQMGVNLSGVLDWGFDHLLLVHLVSLVELLSGWGPLSPNRWLFWSSIKVSNNARKRISLTPWQLTRVAGQRGSRVSVVDGQSRSMIHVETEFISEIVSCVCLNWFVMKTIILANLYGWS